MIIFSMYTKSQEYINLFFVTNVDYLFKSVKGAET